jgi:hypothetical protein
MKFNKKVIYLSVFLILILFLISACQQYKGRYISTEYASYGVCEEDWECSEWSECINKQQTRTCDDLNKCGMDLNKPSEVKDCESDNYYLKVGDSVTVDSKEVQLVDVGSGGNIIVSIAGVQDVIVASTTKIVNGLELKNNATFYTDTKAERSAWLNIKKLIIGGSNNQRGIYDLDYDLKIGELIEYLGLNITLNNLFEDGSIELEVNKEIFRLHIGENITITRNGVVIVFRGYSHFDRWARIRLSSKIIEYSHFSIFNFESIPRNPGVGESTLIHMEDAIVTNKKIFNLPKKIKITIFYEDILNNLSNQEIVEEMFFSCNPFPTVTPDRCLIDFNYKFLNEGVYKFLIENFDENDKKLETKTSPLIERDIFVFVINDDKIETNKFPIGLWLWAYYLNNDRDIINSNQFDQIKNLGIDTIIDGKANNLKFNKELLFLAQKNGINVLLPDTKLDNFNYNPADPQIYKDLTISDLKKLIEDTEINYNHFNSLYRYYLNDEPFNELEIDFIKDVVNELNNINTPRTGTTTLYQDLDLIEYYYKNVNSQEVIVDHYPLFSDTPKQGPELQRQLDMLINTLDNLNKFSKIYNKPFWFIVQAHQWKVQADGKIDENYYTRAPTPKEIKAMAYLALAYGSKGIFYFYYWSDPKIGSKGLVDENLQPNEKYYEVKKINEELKIIRDVLIELKNINTCNSKSLASGKENYLNNVKWEFDQNGFKYDYSQDNSGRLSLYFNGLDLKNIINKEDVWFDFWYYSNINTGQDKYIKVDYEIIKNPNKLNFYFNPKRENEVVENILLPSNLGSHIFIINLKNLKGINNINRVEFFISNNPKGEFEVEINSIEDYNCELPYISEAMGNIEIGNFIHKNGEKYIMLVNRDTNNQIITKITLNKNNLGNVYLYDVLTGESIYSEPNELYTFNYNLNAGDGRLLKIVEY